MEAFFNDSKIQQKYIKRVQKHFEADEIIHGKYWEEGKGCAVGCTIQGSEHSRYETELGIPKEVAYLEDVIFEGLTNGISKEFPRRFINAVPLGADLSLVTAKFMVWQFEDKKFGLRNIKEIADDEELMKICRGVVRAYKKIIKGEIVEQETWEKLYKKADEMYWARAGAWAWARAGAGAGAGARARAWAGAWAWARAWAGAWAWARAGAGARAGARAGAGAYDEKPYWEAMADKLISLIEECK